MDKHPSYLVKQILEYYWVNEGPNFHALTSHTGKSSIKGFVARGLSTKTRFVSGGHMNDTLSSLTCPTVPIILMIIALNGLEIFLWNRTIWRESIFIAGPEFGSDQGKILIVQRGLY